MAHVLLYTKPTCSYCHAAKDLLDNKGVQYTEITLTDLSDSDKEELARRTNHYRTVPQIFINGSFVGGFDQLRTLDNQGSLDNLLGDNSLSADSNTDV